MQATTPMRTLNMAKIEGLRIKNFKVLKDVALGRLWSQQIRKKFGFWKMARTAFRRFAGQATIQS